MQLQTLQSTNFNKFYQWDSFHKITNWSQRMCIFGFKILLKTIMICWIKRFVAGSWSIPKDKCRIMMSFELLTVNSFTLMNKKLTNWLHKQDVFLDFILMLKWLVCHVLLNVHTSNKFSLYSRSLWL